MAVVAVPFILYLVRFCSSKSCKQYEYSYKIWSTVISFLRFPTLVCNSTSRHEYEYKIWRS